MKSLWSEFSMPSFKKLDRNIKTDVLIIGGGIAGLLIAYELYKRGINCVTVEAKKICEGITNCTTAKITSQHGLIYERLVSSSGKEVAQKYLNANEKAIDKYREICKNINCDFEEKSSYVFLRENSHLLEKEIKALELISSLILFNSVKRVLFSSRICPLIKIYLHFFTTLSNAPFVYEIFVFSAVFS